MATRDDATPCPVWRSRVESARGLAHSGTLSRLPSPPCKFVKSVSYFVERVERSIIQRTS
jgi:hypothetical protein